MPKRKYEEYECASNDHHTKHSKHEKLHESRKVANLIKALDEILNDSGSEKLDDEKSALCRQLRTSLKHEPHDAMHTPHSPPELRETPVENVPKLIAPLSLTPWTASEIPAAIPPLPAVLDPTLEASVFIHRAHAHKAHYLSYERLEWVGDAYVQLIATLIIAQTFPASTPGEQSYIRQLLVKNVTLARYAQQYGLPPRVKLPLDIQSSSEKDKIKIWGDVFEAYVAAVILSDPSNGVERCSAWLKSLWSLEIAKELRKEEAKGPRLVTPMWSLMGGTNPVDQAALPKAQLNAKERLAKAILSRGIKLTYRDAAPEQKDKKTNLPMFTIGVYLDGWGEKNKQIGFGRGHGKKDAGHRAAEMALSNQKLMKTYMEKKKLFDAQMALEEAAAEAQSKGT